MPGVYVPKFCYGDQIEKVNCPHSFQNGVPDTAPPDPKTKLCVDPRQ